jgi:integrase
MNPFGKIRQRRVADKPVEYILPEQLAAVLEEAPTPWWKTYLMTAYTTAGRKGELLNLTWADIDFENNEIRFVPKKAARRVLAWEPKNHKCRSIPTPASVIQSLANLQDQADECSPYVFITRPRLARILRKRARGEWEETSELVNNMLTRLKSFCRRAGVSEFCIHDLRRSCITNWAKRLPIHAVQELAGHSKIETTRRYYLSVGRADMTMARQIQDEVLTQLTNY